MASESYYDKILEDFDMGRESEAYMVDEAYDINEDIYDDYTEDLFESRNRRRPIKTPIPRSVGKPANFGRNVPPSPARRPAQLQGDFVTKAELRTSLNSISEQVNDLKKTSLGLANSIKKLDAYNDTVVKSIAKKDRAQDNIMSSSTMMSLMGTMVNKPTLNPAALQIKEGKQVDGKKEPDTIELVKDQDPIQVDLTKTLLFTMMPAMMNSNSSGGDNSMMMMLMMVLLLDKNKTGNSGNSNDNTMLMMVPMMMMMMNKK